MMVSFGVQGLPIKYTNTSPVELPGDFVVWVASPEAKFLKGKFVWCNWDVEEMKVRAKEIESSTLLTIGLDGFATSKY